MNKTSNFQKIKDFFNFDVHSKESQAAFILIVITWFFNRYIYQNPNQIIHEVMMGFLTIITIWVVVSYFIKLSKSFLGLDIKKAQKATHTTK